MYVEQPVSNRPQASSASPEALDLWHPLLVGAGEWGTRCCSTAIAVNKQWLDFLQKRLKADLEMPQRFMSCSSPYEAWSVHVGFLQKTITDYQKELTALAKLGVVKLPTRGE